MKFIFDKAKREKTLEERGLGFLDAEHVFNGATFEFEDLRKDYGKNRIITVGHLAGRMVIVGYVQRSKTKHIFSMRKANEREIKKYQKQFEEN